MLASHTFPLQRFLLQLLFIVGALQAGSQLSCSTMLLAAQRPNVLIAISDDVSFPHASAYGCNMVQTPAFDSIAKNGILFNNAYSCAPGCSPSRAALLTGRHIWMIEEAGTHASYFQKKYVTFPEALHQAGYFVGSTGKAWAPGNFRQAGRSENPAGKLYGGKKKKGHVAAFQSFLDQQPDDQPFCFWFGGHDAHRPYVKGSGIKSGLDPASVDVPRYLPDTPEIRSDLLDYAFEVNRFDGHVKQMLQILEDKGELENTLVIYTSDNGMPFPRAKANCYDAGIHMPLAISWPKHFPGNRVSDDLVSFVDLTATIYEAANVVAPKEFPGVGVSLVDELKTKKSGRLNPDRQMIVAGRERHSSSRYNSLGYPIRALRTKQWLYIINFTPERWPAGPQQKYSKATYDQNDQLVQSTLADPDPGYHDIDACPTLNFLIQHQDDPAIDRCLQMSVAKRSREELFHLPTDPDCLKNLATDSQHSAVRNKHYEMLMKELKRTGDTRTAGDGDVWETYPRVSGLRWFPKPLWVKQQPDLIPEQPWLDKKRPRVKTLP